MKNLWITKNIAIGVGTIDGGSVTCVRNEDNVLKTTTLTALIGKATISYPVKTVYYIFFCFRLTVIKLKK